MTSRQHRGAMSNKPADHQYEKMVKADSGIKARIECDHEHRLPMLLRRERRLKREARLITKPMRFVSLHHHSTYSSLDGFQLPEAHVRRATELQMSSLAMTEHGNISSHDNLEVAAKAAGVKPIYGCELYTGHVDRERRAQRKYHLTVLAKNEIGYRNLLKLVSLSWGPGFYYEPTVSWQWLKDHREGLIILSGCQGSLLFCSAVGGKLIAESDAGYARARKVASAFQRAFGDSYFIECQAFPDLEKTRQFNPMAERLSRDLGVPLVATMDCHYTVPEEQEIQILLHNVRGGGRQTLEEQVRDWGYSEHLCPPPTDKSIYRRLRASGLGKRAAQEAIINTELIAQGIESFDLPMLPALRYQLPAGYGDSTDLFKDWLREGWLYRGCDKLPRRQRQEYKERLKYECGIIEQKDFADYFLVVSDAVRFAKDSGIPVGPARGSAAASIVCWLLRITEVNPMLFPNLVFERFIDISRQDLPDIDLDFASEGRPRVREYLVNKYGEECVSNIGTFTKYKSKNSLDDVARIYKVPSWKIDVVKDLLIERSSGDLRASATIEDTVLQFDKANEVFKEHPELYKAMELEGNVRGMGVHSGGLVVSNGPISDVCAVYTRKVAGEVRDVVSVDKRDAERRNLLKIDVLGLSTMSTIAHALDQLDMRVEELYDIPLDDPEVIDGFRKNDVVGVFQFDGRAMRQVNGNLQPDSFKEVCDVNALARPGPLHNGAANEYIDIKRGVEQPDILHEALEPITKHTHYQIVYQEQILRIVVEIGGFDWTHAALIRKIISKKHGEAEFNSHWERFWKGAKTCHKRLGCKPMKQHEAQRIWGMLITAGSYAFNYAHCVSYGMLAYWTMWLKKKHPSVFYSSSLACMPQDKHLELLRDAVKHGLTVLPPHPQNSRQTWRAVDGRLQAGFTQIPGVGDKTADNIEAYRRQYGLSDWNELINVKGIGPKTIENMLQFVNQEDPFKITWIDDVIAEALQYIENNPDAGIPMPTHEGDQIPYTRGGDTHLTWIGVAKNRNLRDIFESNRSRTGIELDPDTVERPELNEFMIMHGWDGHDIVSIRFNRFMYPKFREAIWGLEMDKDLVVVRGTKPGWRTAREVYVEDMWVLTTD